MRSFGRVLVSGSEKSDRPEATREIPDRRAFLQKKNGVMLVRQRGKEHCGSKTLLRAENLQKDNRGASAMERLSVGLNQLRGQSTMNWGKTHSKGGLRELSIKGSGRNLRKRNIIKGVLGTHYFQDQFFSGRKDLPMVSTKSAKLVSRFRGVR